MSSEDIPGPSAELIECIRVVVEEALDRRGDRGRDGPVDGTAGSSSSAATEPPGAVAGELCRFAWKNFLFSLP